MLGMAVANTERADGGRRMLVTEEPDGVTEVRLSSPPESPLAESANGSRDAIVRIGGGRHAASVGAREDASGAGWTKEADSGEPPPGAVSAHGRAAKGEITPEEPWRRRRPPLLWKERARFTRWRVALCGCCSSSDGEPNDD